MTTLLDGGMGQELINRGAPRSAELWSAWALLEDPGLVTAVHLDYVEAGADVITTNSYSTFADRLALHGLGDQAEKLTRLAGDLAREVADSADRDVRVAGSLPPLRHSYNPPPNATSGKPDAGNSKTVTPLAGSNDLSLFFLHFSDPRRRRETPFAFFFSKKKYG